MVRPASRRARDVTATLPISRKHVLAERRRFRRGSISATRLIPPTDRRSLGFAVGWNVDGADPIILSAERNLIAPVPFPKPGWEQPTAWPSKPNTVWCALPAKRLKRPRTMPCQRRPAQAAFGARIQGCSHSRSAINGFTAAPTSRAGNALHPLMVAALRYSIAGLILLPFALADRLCTLPDAQRQGLSDARQYLQLCRAGDRAGPLRAVPARTCGRRETGGKRDRLDRRRADDRPEDARR
jgi:hypothetical protein